LRDTLQPDVESRATITRLFGHSVQDSPSLLRAVRETPPFLRALRGVLRLV
jgi:hypothetical protein